MYTEKVLDHFSHPRNMGELKDANGVGMVGNAKCGDIMQMFLKIDDDGIICFSSSARLQIYYLFFKNTKTNS